MRARPAGTVNANLASGKVEVLAHELEVLNRSEPLPFQLDEARERRDAPQVPLLDLRRDGHAEAPAPAPQGHARDAQVSSTTHGFIDIETPMLTKATPEGARDYLVPSRMHAGKFFALPQSPQLFKQLLMVAGFDRYYQIVQVLPRRGPARRPPARVHADRHRDLVPRRRTRSWRLMEELMRHFFKDGIGVELPNPFPRMTYAEAMRRYGSDKPDLRNPLELIEVADLVDGCDFKVFAGPANDPKGRVAALRVPGGGAMPRRRSTTTPRSSRIYGAKGLAYIKVNETAKGRDGLQSPIVKFLSDDAVDGHPRAHRRAKTAT